MKIKNEILEIEVEIDSTTKQQFLLKLKSQSNYGLVLERLDNKNIVKIFINNKSQLSSISFFDKNNIAYLKSKNFEIITLSTKQLKNNLCH